MAENQRFLKGLFKDTGHLDQPKATWRYALNAIIQTTKGAVSNEPGTIIQGIIPENCLVIGAIEISDGRVVLFLKENDAGVSADPSVDIVSPASSYIGIWKKPNSDTPFDLEDVENTNGFRIL